MTDLIPKFYLDSMVWIALAGKPDALRKIVDLNELGTIQILKFSQNLDELLDPQKVSLINQEINVRALESIDVKTQPDAIFVVGLSQIGYARLSGETVQGVYEHHLLGKKELTNHFRDGIHLVNSLEETATLVTCDEKLKGSGSKDHVMRMCLAEFDREFALGLPVPCRSCINL